MSDNRKESTSRLLVLQQKLSQLGRAWTIDDYNNFLAFYMNFIPNILHVERCTIYLRDKEHNTIFSVFATGIEGKKIEPPLEGSIAGEVIRSRKTITVNDLTTTNGFHLEMDKQTGFVSRNTICAPIHSLTSGEIIGAIQLLNKKDNERFDRSDKVLLEEIAGYLVMSIESILLNREILQVASKINREAKSFELENPLGFSFIAESQAMREVLDMVHTVSGLDINILLQGENGTGKELIAKIIHSQSLRAKGPFVPVNCACIPENLIESEFFGHEKGAFTDASTSRKGRFERAKGGTLFLDEIGDMALHIQPKFLRAIQEGEGSRLGSNKTIKYDVRLISASNKNLAQEIKKGNFREDLFFRIYSIDIEIPPLRERQDDILPLALSFLDETNRRFEKNVEGFSSETIQLFEAFHWPGNVRQLKKEVERLVALTTNGEIISTERCSRDLLAFLENNQPSKKSKLPQDLSIPNQVKKLETALIQKALAKTNNNKSQAAELLKITRQGLFKKMKRYRIN